MTTSSNARGSRAPLLRNDESYGAVIESNQLTNVADTDRYDNPQTDAKAGLEEPLKFNLRRPRRVHSRRVVDAQDR